MSKKKRGLFISASAGTGKTTRLVMEYLNAFEKNKDLTVDNVVAITFTRKAAKEMKERIREELSKKYKVDAEDNKYTSRWLELRSNLNFAWISTIHSFCERILKENAIFIPIDPGFQVLTGIRYSTFLERQVVRFVTRKIEDSESSETLEELLRYFGLDKTIELFKDAIRRKRLEVYFGSGDLGSEPKPLLPDLEEANEIKEAIRKFKDNFDELYSEFRDMIFEEAKLDFETLLFETYKLLKEKESIRRKYIKRFKYIFVDEFQDTNEIQKQIIDLLHDPKENFVLFVGDPKQSIYKFRGADVTVFTKTEMEFAESQKDKLEKNYRSHPDLVKFFNRFFPHVLKGGRDPFEISYSHSQFGKTPEEFKPVKGKRVKILNGEVTEKLKAEDIKIKEAQLIARFIVNRVKEGENSFKDFVILLRKFEGEVNYVTKVFDEYSIPYYAVSSGGFYNRPEIFAILAFLNILNDPLDNKSFTALLLSPFFKFTFDELMKLKGSERKIYDALLKKDDQKIQEFLKLHSKYMKLKEVISVGELVEMIINDTDYLSKLAFFKNSSRMIINVKKFIEISKDLSNEGYSLREFVSQMKKYSPTEESEASLESEENDVVRIMTIHKSKGLQFPVVILPRIFSSSKNSTENILYDDTTEPGRIYLNPYSESKLEDSFLGDLFRMEKKKDLEEEKRILYVAMTRAENELILCGIDNSSSGGKTCPWGTIFKSMGFYDVETRSWIVPENFEDLVEIVQSSSLPDQKYNGIVKERKPIKQIPKSVFPLKDVAKRTYISPTHIYGEINIDEVLKLDEVIRPDRVKDMGILVHEILEQVGSRSLKGTVTTLKSLKRARPRLVDEANFTEADLEAVWHDLSRWFDNPYMKQIENSERCYSELSVSKKFGDRILYGVIDKIFFYEGEWIIADFKYANYNPISEDKYRFQLLFYTYTTEELFKPSPRKALLFYLKEKGGNMVREFRFTDEDLKEFELKVEEKIEKFERTIKSWEMEQRYTLGQVDFRSPIG